MVNKLEMILNIAQDVLFEFDYSGTYLNIWTNNEALLIKPKSELLGLQVSDVIPEPDTSYFLEIIQKTIDTKKESNIDYTILTPSGLCYFSGKVVPFLYKGEKTVILHAKDVTAEKHKDMVISDIEKVAKIGTWEFEPETQKYSWSEQVYHIHEMSLDAKVEESVELYDEESRDLIQQAIKACLSDNTPYIIELYLTTKSGNRKILRATGYPLLDTNLKIYRIAGTLQDITQHNILSRAFEDQKVKLDRVLEHTPGVFFQFKRDKDGKFSFPYMSSNVYKIFGYRAEAVSDDVSIILNAFHPDDQESFYEAVEKSYRNLSDFEWRGRLFSGNEELRWIMTQSIPKKQEDGSIIWDGIVFDITRRMKKEEELEQKQKTLNHQLKLASLGELAAGVAHEINNPLAIVDSVLDRINRHKDRDDFNSEKLATMIEYASDAIKRIETITKGLGVFSRVDASLKSEFDITEAVKTTTDLLKELYRGNSIQIKFSCEEKEHIIFGNRGRLDQVLMNLVSNAKDAVSDLDQPLIVIVLKCNEINCEITVTDNGPGIPEEIQDKIFDPFFSTKEVGRGTGIGLSIANSIVHEHDGKIVLKSKPGETTFKVVFPKISSKIGESV